MTKQYNFGLLTKLEQRLVFKALVNIEAAWAQLDTVVNDSFSTLDAVSYDLDMRGESESPLSELLASVRGHIEGIECDFNPAEKLDPTERVAFKAWYDSMALDE